MAGVSTTNDRSTSEDIPHTPTAGVASRRIVVRSNGHPSTTVTNAAETIELHEPNHYHAVRHELDVDTLHNDNVSELAVSNPDRHEPTRSKWYESAAKFTNALVSLALVALGIAISWIWGKVSQKQNHASMLFNVWRACQDLPVSSPSRYSKMVMLNLFCRRSNSLSSV